MTSRTGTMSVYRAVQCPVRRTDAANVAIPAAKTIRTAMCTKPTRSHPLAW